MTKELKVKWPLIATEFDKPYLNYIDLGNFTMFRMAIFKTKFPRLGMFVAIEDIGAFFFGKAKWLHMDYVAEKLRILGDHGQIADFLNAQLEIEGKQQGHYYWEVVEGVKPCGKIGEHQIMPWKPEIIWEEKEDKLLLFRFHRGSLEDSMATIVEIKSESHLINVIQGKLELKLLGAWITPYCFDERTQWDTYMVRIITSDDPKEFYPIGFLNRAPDWSYERTATLPE